MLTKKSEQVDLKKCCTAELKDILDRQLKLLNNSKFISKLPDKGKKIKFYKEKLEQELEARSSLHDTCELMSKMALNQLPNKIEWCGKKAFDEEKENDMNNDDDEDERNPLKIVASHSGTIKSYTKKIETPEPSLVTSKDLEDTTINTNTPLYATKICYKFDKSIAFERFKPNEPKDKVFAKERLKRSTEHVRERLGKNWEITAATPPIPVHVATEMVSLSDSLLLQHEQARRVKEIQLEEAMSRLRENVTEGTDFQACLPTRNLMKYRDPTVLFEGTPVSTNHENNASDKDVEIDEVVNNDFMDDVNG